MLERGHPSDQPAMQLTEITGYHVFSVLAADGDGKVRTADPKLVIVKPGQTHGRSVQKLP